MNFSNIKNLSELENFIENPKEEVSAIVDTFTASVNINGPDTFVPMLFLFGGSPISRLAVECRPTVDKDDMYKAFAEMLQLYEALNCSAFLLANDVRISSYDSSDSNAKNTKPTDALTITFVNFESSGVLSLPYQVNNNKDVHWLEDCFEITSLAEDDPSKKPQGDMVDLLYIMSHLKGPMFTPSQILNYLSYKKFHYIFSDDSQVDKIKVNI